MKIILKELELRFGSTNLSLRVGKKLLGNNLQNSLTSTGDYFSVYCVIV